MDDLKHYRLKPEYLDLFRNLATGQEFVQKAAFDKPDGPHPKSYSSEDLARQHREILERLAAAGFVEVIATGVYPKMK